MRTRTASSHRGLKPSRIHVLPDGTVKVRQFSVDFLPSVDFGSRQQPVELLLSQHFQLRRVLDELTASCEERPALLESIIERATA